jgi:hypothetical protein
MPPRQVLSNILRINPLTAKPKNVSARNAKKAGGKYNCTKTHNTFLKLPTNSNKYISLLNPFFPPNIRMS